MLFAFICKDKPGEGLELRLANRPDHVAWLKGLGAVLKFAGPLMDDAGAEMRGSLVVVEADNIADARAISAQDPFFKMGVFESVEVHAWNWTLGRPEGV